MLDQPAFVDLETIKATTAVAHNLAVARKAIEEIRRIEKKLISAGASKKGLHLAMTETAELADRIASESREAIATLKSIRSQLDSYLPELQAYVRERQERRQRRQTEEHSSEVEKSPETDTPAISAAFENTGMASYDYICPSCDVELEATRNLSAETVTCPNCSREFKGADGDPVERVLAKYATYIRMYEQQGKQPHSCLTGDTPTPALQDAVISICLGVFACCLLIFGPLAAIWNVRLILPLWCLSSVCAVAAIIYGCRALRRIAKGEQPLSGKPAAGAGIGCGAFVCFMQLVFVYIIVTECL